MRYNTVCKSSATCAQHASAATMDAHLSKFIHFVHCELFGAKQSVLLDGSEWQVVCSVGIFVGIDHFSNMSQCLVLDTI